MKFTTTQIQTNKSKGLETVKVFATETYNSAITWVII